MAALCPHGFPNPVTQYGEILLPPQACNACRSDYFSRAVNRPGVAYNALDQAFEEGPWDSSRNLFHQNANDPSKVQGSLRPNEYGPRSPPPDPIEALPETQELRQRPKPPRSSRYNVLFLDDNNGSHVAKRRGPLTEDGRDNIKRLRTVGGACWRCKVLRKQCNGETPCKECSATRAHARKWHLKCRRGDIKDDIKGKIPDLALGTGEWFQPEDKDTQYRVRITHNSLDPKSVIKDCEYLAGKVTSSTKAELAILDFVEQFYDVDARWSQTHTQYSLEFVKKCAQLQAGTLSQALNDLRMPAKVLVALSLRCLMLTREIPLADMLIMDGKWSEYEDENPQSPTTIDGSDIEILELKTSNQHAHHTHDRTNSKGISQALEELLQTTQGLIMRRKPKDWPTVLFTLCLLDTVKRNWSYWVFDPVYAALSNAYYDLCGLFEVTSKSFHPLCNKWDKEAYSRLVDGNDVLVGAFQWMHDQWLKRVSIDAPEDHFYDDHLGERIAFFLDDDD